MTLIRITLVALAALQITCGIDAEAQVAPPLDQERLPSGLPVRLLESDIIGTIETTESRAMATTPVATTAPLGQRLDAIFDAPQWENARWGVIVQDLETSKILYDRDGEKSFMPASNMKLFTTAAALVTLGESCTFETNIYATGTTDSRGVLNGNIYIIGSGDPSISGRYLEDKSTTGILAEWAGAIKTAGITRIEGDIIGDDDIFDDSFIAGSWQYDYLQEWYAAENSGLAINDNCWDIIVEPRQSIARQETADEDGLLRTSVGKIDPLKTSYYTVSIADVEAIPDNDNSTTAPKEEEARLSISRLPESNQIFLSGTIEEDSAPVKEWGSIHNGTLFTVTLLAEELQRQGITVTGKPVDIDDINSQMSEELKKKPGTLIHSHLSPPLSRILPIVNKPSQNFYADMLLKAVGAHAHDLGSWSNGESVVKDLLTTVGVNPGSLNMADGSGLSRRNLIEPRQALALLVYMYGRPDFEIFEGSLPVMGVDGTLRSRMKGTPAEGNVKAKTGTIGGVRALSGYLTANNGNRLAFSMIANNYYTPTSEASEAQNQALLEMMQP